MLVLSSLSPLYILWIIRGNAVIPDAWIIGSATVLVLGSYGVLAWRIHTARQQADYKDLSVHQIKDHREHLLTYLVATMLPLYDANLTTRREAAAILAAFVFVVFLFWHMNLHYMNPLFAVFRYHILSIEPSDDSDPSYILITRRSSLRPGSSVRALRISNTVFLELTNT